MLQHATRSTYGAIDSSLNFIVTSFVIENKDISDLPRWFQSEIPLPAPRKSRIDRLFDNLHRTNNLAAPKHLHDADWESFDPHPHFFIGEKTERLKFATAPKLPSQLSELGFVLVRRKIYIKDFVNGKPRYILNIYWNRRALSHDTESIAETIRQNSSLVFEWSVRSSWSVKGLEFSNQSRVILLDFRYREITLPSQRQFEIVVVDNQLQATGVRYE